MAKNDTTGLLQWRVNYQHVAKNHQLRGGTVVVEAPTITEANERALKLLAEYGLQNYRLTNTKPF